MTCDRGVGDGAAPHALHRVGAPIVSGYALAAACTQMRQAHRYARQEEHAPVCHTGAGQVHTTQRMSAQETHHQHGMHRRGDTVNRMETSSIQSTKQV